MVDYTLRKKDSKDPAIKVVGAANVYAIRHKGGVEKCSSLNQVAKFLLTLAPLGDWDRSSRATITSLEHKS